MAFAALCAERPGERWPLLQTMVDAEEASRLLVARELTIEEKREFVDLRIEGWLRGLPDALAKALRPAWVRLRELPKDEFELDAIQRMIALERLRGAVGAQATPGSQNGCRVSAPLGLVTLGTLESSRKWVTVDGRSGGWRDLRSPDVPGPDRRPHP